MFYYYGRKKQIAGYYPTPEHATIVEPFAGSAAYALHGDNWEKNVQLYDTSPLVVDLWLYLKDATVDSIASLPDLEVGQNIDTFNLSPVEKSLIGLHINPGSSMPKKTATKCSRWPAGKRYIQENLYKIKHWSMELKDYRDVKNTEATWFIDPPYQSAGVHYSKNNIDYLHLSAWVKSRRGQVIACEGEGARYLPFRSLVAVNNGGLNKAKRKMELVWCNSPPKEQSDD